MDFSPLNSKTWDWTSKQSTLLFIRAILTLPKNRRKLNWTNSRVKNINFPQSKRRLIKHIILRVLQNDNSQQTSHFYISKKVTYLLPLLTDQGHTIFKWISTERSVVHWTKYHNWVKNENKIYSEEYLCAWLTHSSFLISSTSRAR